MKKVFILALINWFFVENCVGSLIYLIPVGGGDIQVAVDAHNEKRRIPYASNMKLMEWDENLQHEAEEYAKQCIYAHDPNLGGTGENLHVGNQRRSTLFGDVITQWYNEVSYYNYTTRSCRSGEVCTHYTQIVWADTYKVGCAVAHCSSIQHINIGIGQLTVCRYSPGGNWHDPDGAAFPPYQTGDECTACASGWARCEDGLCSRNVTVTTATSPVVQNETASPMTRPDDTTTTWFPTTVSTSTVAQGGITSLTTRLDETTTAEFNVTDDTWNQPTATSKVETLPTTTNSFAANATTIDETRSPEVSTSSLDQTTSMTVDYGTTSAPTTGSTYSPPIDNCITDDDYIQAFREYELSMKKWRMAFDEYNSEADNMHACGCP